jgi:hypothetical protein
MLFQLQGVGLDQLIAERFFGLPTLFLAFPIASALDAVRPRLGALLVPACVASLLLHGVYQWPRTERASHRFFEAHVHNVLSIVPPGAVVLTQGDAGLTLGLYARYVLGRADVTFVFSEIDEPWYGRRVERALRTEGERPLFLIGRPKTREGAHPPAYPVGPLRRTVGASEAMPDAAELFAHNLALFARMQLPAAGELAALDDWERSELADYADAWQEVAARARAADRHDLAARAEAFRDAVLGRPGELRPAP